jgi:hypothetical protein
MGDSRKTFYESWMTEAPQRTQPRNDLDGITQNINEFKQYYSEDQLSNGLWKLETGDKLFIYGKSGDYITIAVELEKHGQSLSVVSMAKSQSQTGYSPYMSDLYLTALEVTNRSIRFTSDRTLTDAGFSVWSRLLLNGHVISVYDTTNPGQTLTTINTVDELRQYWTQNSDSRKYRFVLSENKKHWLDTVYGPFSTRRLRELANITLDEEYKEQK